MRQCLHRFLTGLHSTNLTASSWYFVRHHKSPPVCGLLHSSLPFGICCHYYPLLEVLQHLHGNTSSSGTVDKMKSRTYQEGTTSRLRQTYISTRIKASECHGYGYTRGFHAGLAAGTGTGTRMPTRQKPIPVPVPIMVMHVAQPNMASRASHLCFLAFTTTSSPCRVSIANFLMFYRSF